MSYNIMEDVRKYRVGIYIRLSKEDEEKGKYNESESISNQRNILLQYLSQNRLDLEEEYVDDGVSGTSFDRPAFNRMIKDIENKRINMVITKDLSRLGRDYIMSGYYTEQYFPSHGVRYIALLDNIDTYLDSSTNDIAPFKSILNDMYAKDISKKIKSVLKNKKERGMFVGKCAPYGYKKDPNDKHKLIIDEPAALIVREIFEKYLQGLGASVITSSLNSRGVDIPTVHKNSNVGYKSPNYGLWCNTTIKRIIANEVYTGTLVQNKYNKLNYKSKKLVETPEEKWIRVENTHEAIVTKEEWDRAQVMLKRNSATRSTGRNDYLLSGLLKCYECKSAIGISNKTGREYSYGRCQRYTKYHKYKVCTPHSFNYQKLEKRILNLLTKICEDYTDISSLKSIAGKNKAIDREIKLKQKYMYYADLEEKENKKIDRLYEDRIDGTISNEEFKRMSGDIIKNRDNYHALKKEYEIKLIEYKENIKNDGDKKIDKLIDEFLNMKTPTKEIIGQFIDRIEIHEDKQVDVYFKFQAFNDIIENKKMYAK